MALTEHSRQWLTLTRNKIIRASAKGEEYSMTSSDFAVLVRALTELDQALAQVQAAQAPVNAVSTGTLYRTREDGYGE